MFYVHLDDNDMQSYAILARGIVEGHHPLVRPIGSGQLLVYDKPATTHAVHEYKTRHHFHKALLINYSFLYQQGLIIPGAQRQATLV